MEKIGRYEIINKLGTGGMAEVLLAEDTLMGRQVAVKLLPKIFLHDPTFIQRFEREVRLLAQLEHTAIVPVYDFGTHDEQPYMVSRYMRGGTLLDRISKHGALPLDQALPIFQRICSALQAAHNKGIIHRDLKPANILFDEDGQAYVSDFGIAKMADSTRTLTGNAIVGTPAYMSPEHFTEDGSVGPLSDQYSLAIVLYEMLSGRLPFQGNTTARLMKNHLMDAPPPIRELRRDVPEGVEQVLARALSKDPADRFPSLEAFAEALAAAAGSQPVQQQTPPAAQAPPVEFAPPPEAAAPPAGGNVYATNIYAREEMEPAAPEDLVPSRPAVNNQKADNEAGKAKKKSKPGKRRILVGCLLIPIVVPVLLLAGAMLFEILTYSETTAGTDYDPSRTGHYINATDHEYKNYSIQQGTPIFFTDALYPDGQPDDFVQKIATRITLDAGGSRYWLTADDSWKSSIIQQSDGSIDGIAHLDYDLSEEILEPGTYILNVKSYLKWFHYTGSSLEFPFFKRWPNHESIYINVLETDDPVFLFPDINTDPYETVEKYLDISLSGLQETNSNITLIDHHNQPSLFCSTFRWSTLGYNNQSQINLQGAGNLLQLQEEGTYSITLDNGNYRYGTWSQEGARENEVYTLCFNYKPDEGGWVQYQLSDQSSILFGEVVMEGSGEHGIEITAVDNAQIEILEIWTAVWSE